MLDVGVTIIAFKFEAFDQVYELAPLAFNVSVWPLQIELLNALMLTGNAGANVTERVWVSVQVPFAPVTV